MFCWRGGVATTGGQPRRVIVYIEETYCIVRMFLGVVKIDEKQRLSRTGSTSHVVRREVTAVGEAAPWALMEREHGTG